MGSRKIKATAITTSPITTFKISTLPSISFADSLSFCPKRIDIRELAPTPTSEPNAAQMFDIGNVTPIAVRAIGPTPCPIHIESTKLYNDDANMAIIAGVAYCRSNIPKDSVPKFDGMDVVVATDL